MNWDDLRVFIAVARKSTLGAAALSLKINESTISRRIQRLERQIGLTLFERSRKGHHLTARGKVLLEHCERIDREAAACFDISNSASQYIEGTLRVSTAEGFGATIMVPAIKEFISQHPCIEIDLISGSGFLSLSRREADISIGLSKPKSKRLKSQKLLDYELGLFVGPEYKKNTANIHSPPGFKNHTLIGYVDDLIYAPELDYFESIFPNQTPQIRCSSIMAQKQFVIDGAGIAILPTFIANDKLIRLLATEVAIKRSFWLTAHKSICETARYKSFEHFILDFFDQPSQ